MIPVGGCAAQAAADPGHVPAERSLARFEHRAAACYCFKAIELVAGDLTIMQIALELGYGSTSAFTYAFRTEMGRSPQTHRLGLG